MIPQGAVWVVCADADATGSQLLSKARELAGSRPIVTVAWKKEALAPGADVAVMLEGADEDLCRTGGMLASLLSKAAPEIVLFPATVTGRALSAWVAAKLHTGLTADCMGLTLDADGLLLPQLPGIDDDLLERPAVHKLQRDIGYPARTA